MTLVFLAGLALVALVPLLLPLLRAGRSEPVGRAYDRAVYVDQLCELDREMARGLLPKKEAAATQLEIQRRLLAADGPATAEMELVPRRSPAIAAVLAVVMAGGATGLYARLGAPAIPDTPYVASVAAAVAPSPAEHDNLQQAVAQLAAKLKADPSSAEGWLLYARASGSIGKWDQSIDAYRHVLALGHDDADVQAGLGEMLTLQAGGVVTPAAADAFAAALRYDPRNGIGQYYTALAAGQAGEPSKAIDLLQGLLSTIPGDSPMRGEVAKRITEAAKAAGVPAPELAKGTPAQVGGEDESAEAAVAALPSDQQKALIEGMVAKLAARLAQEPGNADDWMRLGRAYAVMGQRDKSGDAYNNAVALRPGDTGTLMQAAEGLLTGLKPEDPLPPRALAFLRQVQVQDPDEPAVLWYLGIDAARETRPADAREYWSKLLTKLPAGGEDAKMVKAAMDSLKGG